MNQFRYQAISGSGATVEGTIEAEDRKGALQVLGERGLFASNLEVSSALQKAAEPAQPAEAAVPEVHSSRRVRKKDITAFTREISALLNAGIPIPQSLDGLGEQEENLALRAVVLKIGQSVRKGIPLSAAMAEHPRL